jgi:hypothetical protein
VWSRVISTKERIVDFITVDVPIIEAEQLVFLLHLVYFKFARSQRCIHLFIIHISALMHTDLLNILILSDTVAFANQTHPSHYFFIIC